MRTTDNGQRTTDERQSPFTSIARKYSRFIRAMFVIGISFGQTASHSPSFEQLPNPSASWRSTMATTRAARSGWPCGRRARWLIFADVKSAADAFLHAATQAPHAIQAAESIALSAAVFGTRIAFPSWAPPTFTEV